jgi:RNA polymerase primary sigma factor
MAKAEAAAKKKSAPDSSDGPLLDMNDSTVKKFIKSAKARGFVTYDELNKVLPSDQNSSEQIEDIMSQLSEMGINVVESEDDVEDSEREQEKERTKTARGGSPAAQVHRARDHTRIATTARTIRCGWSSARWDRSNCFRARARSPLPSVSRPAVTR